jgi:hypothetical protein
MIIKEQAFETSITLNAEFQQQMYGLVAKRIVLALYTGQAVLRKPVQTV